MKKRKELNALIGLAGDSRRKKPKKGSGHRLLRTEPPDSDSESSSEEEEEFGLVGNRSRFVKWVMQWWGVGGEKAFPYTTNGENWKEEGCS